MDYPTFRANMIEAASHSDKSFPNDWTKDRVEWWIQHEYRREYGDQAFQEYLKGAAYDSSD